MFLLKNRFNRIFCETRPIYPTSISSHSIPDFCASEIHDPLFDCCFGLNLEFDEMHKCDAKFVKNNKTRKKKKIKKKQHGTTNNSFRSKICSKSTSDLSSNGQTTIKCFTPNSVENLCDQLDCIGINTLTATPRISRLYTQLPEHDKKILQRMAMKRTNEIAQIQNSCIARKCWDDERTVRDNLMNKLSSQYRNKVKAKQKMESLETERRMNNLARKEQISLDEIRKNINLKEEKFIRRLRAEEIKREVISRQRQLEETRKFEAAAILQHELELDEEVRKQECFSNLEIRINRAEEMRNKHLASRQRRLCFDNEMEQNMHAANYDAAKRNELFKLEQLKLKIQERNKKSNRFMEEKLRYLTESRNQARASAELRDIIRNSISPDSCRSHKVVSACDGPTSNMSFNETHMKMG